MIPTITLDGLSVSDIEAVLDGKNLRRATTSTVNKLATRASTAVKRAINNKYVIKQKDLFARGGSNRNGLKIRKARAGSEVAFILGSGAPLPIARFRMSPKNPEAFKGRKRGKGVTYTVQRGKKVKVRGAFVARMSNGHIGAFIRKGNDRTPIRELFGPSIPQMLGETDSLKEIESVISREGPKIYEHELRFRLQRLFK